LEDREHSKASRPVIDCVKILEAHTFFRKEKLTHEVNLFKFQKISTMVSTASTIAILWVTSNGVISCYQLQHRLLPRRQCWHPSSDVDSIQLSTGSNNLQRAKKTRIFLVASEYIGL